MLENLISMTLDEIKKGYSYESQHQKFICNICGKEFESGEVFRVNDKYYDASRMIKIHIQSEHDDMFDILASNDKKYTGMTENQKDLLRMVYSGMNDSEIAKKNGVASSTIRHQRFVFREKAKQAKLYLALYELASQGADIRKKSYDKNSEFIDMHKGAKMVDDRYFITKEEEEKVIQSMFSSMKPLRLKTFSTKEKKKIVILKKISEQFERDKRYSEREVNDIIKDIYEDFATIRRYLIEYGFMERTKDCKEYWLK
ncbi:DUF2087 domain-containing protein [Proteiniborus sp. MB09-C3]|uniref:DUF2087 domain-containing protein n=1 Tax=Proteiniborus sp. MB09-C3 TaxID=3050072 RepID=UPI002554DCD5|nr:DUF2087 domain-containing protein [Proteiniborus sp. MB09-C3]WIV12484.1 DUF2087 domain-containing protein [Proteiniborus sp. MB09-C3]